MSVFDHYRCQSVGKSRTSERRQLGRGGSRSQPVAQELSGRRREQDAVPKVATRQEKVLVSSRSVNDRQTVGTRRSSATPRAGEFHAVQLGNKVARRIG